MKDEYFLVQIIENKKKETSEGKSTSIKHRLMVSDGTSTLIAMVTKTYDIAEVSPHPLFNVRLQFPKYSIIRLRGNMKVQLVNKRT